MSESREKNTHPVQNMSTCPLLFPGNGSAHVATISRRTSLPAGGPQLHRLWTLQDTGGDGESPQGERPRVLTGELQRQMRERGNELQQLPAMSRPDCDPAPNTPVTYKALVRCLWDEHLVIARLNS
jgi:hypothetical protein